MGTRLLRYIVFLTTLALGIAAVYVMRIAIANDAEIKNAHPVVEIGVESEPDVNLPEFVEPDYERLYPPSPDGAYFPINDRGFENDTALVMSFFDGLTSGSIKIGPDFLDSNLVLDSSRKVRLETKKSHGINYVFEGRFLKDGFKERFEDGETVLSGTLSKFKAGKKIYSSSAKWMYDSEVCAWNPNNQ